MPPAWVSTTSPSTCRANLYGTTDPFNTVLRVALDGTVEVLLTAADGPDGPTATGFGVGADNKNLYITNAAFPFFSGPDPRRPACCGSLSGSRASRGLEVMRKIRVGLDESTFRVLPTGQNMGQTPIKAVRPFGCTCGRWVEAALGNGGAELESTETAFLCAWIAK